ncbi:MAG TPA: hypothetical protein VMN58_08620 [Acidimicrobiales bacterium]|nr:hypothetical protein [Acidimicrobiales bacterium]
MFAGELHDQLDDENACLYDECDSEGHKCAVTLPIVLAVGEPSGADEDAIARQEDECLGCWLDIRKGDEEGNEHDDGDACYDRVET